MKQSGIPGADYGVFAAREFEPGVHIGHYTGKIVARKNGLLQNAYSVATEFPGYVLDAAAGNCLLPTSKRCTLTMHRRQFY